jgi:type II secretory pathway component HofQ
VATTDTTAKRFEVTEEKFQRKVRLQQGDKVLATLYLGTSPNMRQTHVRIDGETDVYALNINHHDAPSKPADWVDTGLVQVDTASLQRIEGPDYALSKENDTWQLSELNEQETTNEQSVQTVINSLQNLRFLEALGTEVKAEYKLDQPVLTLSLQKTDGTTTYQFGKPTDADYVVLKPSDQNLYFKIPNHQLDQLLNVKRESLAKLKPEQKSEEAQEETETTG